MLLATATEAFATTLRPSAREPGRVFAGDFGARKMAREVAVLDMAQRSLVPAWERCVRAALSAQVAVEDEIAKSQNAQVSGFAGASVSAGARAATHGPLCTPAPAPACAL